MTPLNLSELRFLIVDDNSFMRQIIKSILLAFHCGKVQTAEDGAEALQIIQSTPPDIVLTDMAMPLVDGIELTRAVRKSTNLDISCLPIIMISAHSDTDRIRKAIDTGINEFLVKPISPKVLFERLRRVVQNPRDYIQAEAFFGPDRRRHLDKGFHGEERRHDPVL